MSLKATLERIQKARKAMDFTLDLSKLKLGKIPLEISTLTQLTSLDLSGNQLTEIKGLEHLTQLTSLNLSGNQLTEIKGLEHLTQLTSLNLSGNQLTEIKGLEQLIQLRVLNLNNNRLAEIKNLNHFIYLTRLHLDQNRISEIKGLDKLTSLVELNLYENNIKKIKSLDFPRQLTTLSLGSNQISEIKSLDGLTQLTNLYLWGNKITEIKGLKNLNNLREITLGQNNLTDIKVLINIKKLKRVTLNNNSITKLPEEILELELPIFTSGSLAQDGIHLHENTFSDPPQKIIEQGNKAIEEYFNQRKKSGEELLNEAKLILLGDGRSGKTSFSNRLLGKELPKEADRTQGIDIVIGEYSFPIANGKDFKINIWDFAGQDKYKTLHQLFYTESSLYVMVAESGNMTTDYDDWFQTTALFGEGSPLVLMLNEFKAGIGMSSFDSNY